MFIPVAQAAAKQYGVKFEGLKKLSHACRAEKSLCGKNVHTALCFKPPNLTSFSFAAP